MLSLESTTYPGTTKEELLPFIENAGFKIGNDYFLIYSPEREDPGNKEFNTTNIPKILGGITSNCNIIGKLLYSKVIKEVIAVDDTATAEMTKLLENIHRAVNIGLMNELKPLAEKMGVDLYAVIGQHQLNRLVSYHIIQGLVWWTLYPDRSILFNMEGKGVWNAYKFIELAGLLLQYINML